MNKMILILYLLISQFLHGQTYEQNIADYDSLSATNLPHEESEEFINFYEAKTNIQLVDAIFDIATLGGADFAVHSLGGIINRRLQNDDPRTRMEFRDLCFQKLETITTTENLNQVGFSLVLIELLEREIRARRLVEGSENDPVLNEEIVQLFSGLYSIGEYIELNPNMRGRALHYLGRQYSNKHKHLLINALQDPNIEVIKGASSGIRKYLHFIENENDKEEYVEPLINAVNEHIHNTVLRPGTDGSNPRDYIPEVLLMKTTLNAIGMIDLERPQLFLADMYEKETNHELKQQAIFALSYKADKNRLRYLLKTLDGENNSSHREEYESLLSGIILENETEFRSLKTNTDSLSIIRYLIGVRTARLELSETEKNDITNMLNSSVRRIRLEAVKTIHYIYTFDEQVQILSRHKLNETDGEIKWYIEKFIGQ